MNDKQLMLKDKLVSFLSEKGISQQEFADEIGFHFTQVSRWMNGHAGMNVAAAIAIKKRYGLDLMEVRRAKPEAMPVPLTKSQVVDREIEKLRKANGARVAANKELREENERLLARIAALESEVTALKARVR